MPVPDSKDISDIADPLPLDREDARLRPIRSSIGRFSIAARPSGVLIRLSVVVASHAVMPAYALAGRVLDAHSGDFVALALPDELVASQVLAHAAPGKIVVIHDGHHRNPQADRRYAIEATRRIIEVLPRQGYEFSTL